MNTNDPAWMDTLIFQGRLSDIYHSVLSVAVYNKLQTDEPLGVVEIALKKLSIGREVDCWFDLSPPKNEVSGAVTSDTLQVGTVRLTMTLNGPLRKEVQTVCKAFNTVTTCVDKTLSVIFHMGGTSRPYVMNRYTLTAALPFSLLAATLFPAILCVATVGLPLLFPFLLLFVVGTLMIGALLGTVGLLSLPGRTMCEAVLKPVAQNLTDTSVGQQLLFETGPRPSPLALIGALAPTDPSVKLAVSVAIDIIGSSSYAIPFLGESADIVWAPIQAALLYNMYRRSAPWAAYVGFAEELLPFTDILPTATIAWLHENAPGLYDEIKRRIPARNNMQGTN